MGSLIAELSGRVEANARAAVGVYRSEVEDYRLLERDARSRVEAMDYSVWLRRRTIELASDAVPLTDGDLAYMASVGERRAELGLPLPAHKQLIVAHTRLMLREIHEPAGPDDGGDLMCLMRWFGPQGTRGSNAYMAGYLAGQHRRLSFAGRVRMLAEALLTDDPAAAQFAEAVAMPLHPRYLVAVVRVPKRPHPSRRRRRAVTEALLQRHGAPVRWDVPDEMVALLPVHGPETPGKAPGQALAAVCGAEDRALALVRDFADAVGRPCAVGVGDGATGSLARTAAHARRVSRAAPLQDVPCRLHALPDVFLELGVAHVPEAEKWLREIGDALSAGPDLVATLDAYYRNDMNRLRTASALSVHPRTLDYRLRRVQDLSGIAPGSTHGVRVLSVVVGRTLARP